MMFDTFPLRQKRLRQKRLWAVLLFLVLFFAGGNFAFAQQLVNTNKFVGVKRGVEVRYRGQLSSWGSYSSGAVWPLMFGARYLPQLNLEVPINWRKPGGDSGSDFWGGLRFDAEVSGNMYGSGEIIRSSRGDSRRDVSWDARWDGKVKLYRGWGRVSTDRAELRVGLQKINFGSAMMLRPLMWFDSMDPRDPLQMTDGVWGAMGRYYFNNNANIWVWGLLGNRVRRALDILPSDGATPEFGGRVQIPVGRGEMAFSFHRRKTDFSAFGYDSVLGFDSDLLTTGLNSLYENKFGLDMRFDYEIGFWLEAVWINRRGVPAELSNQRMVTVGADYTFGLGNGLGAVVEHMYIEKFNITALNINYPINMNNSLNWMMYYEWRSGGLFNFLRWKHSLSFGDLYVMAFANPNGALIPGMSSGNLSLSGKGIQLMLVINHQTK